MNIIRYLVFGIRKFLGTNNIRYSVFGQNHYSWQLWSQCGDGGDNSQCHELRPHLLTTSDTLQLIGKLETKPGQCLGSCVPEIYYIQARYPNPQCPKMCDELNIPEC